MRRAVGEAAEARARRVRKGRLATTASTEPPKVEELACEGAALRRDGRAGRRDPSARQTSCKRRRRRRLAPLAGRSSGALAAAFAASRRIHQRPGASAARLRRRRGWCRCPSDCTPTARRTGGPTRKGGPRGRCGVDGVGVVEGHAVDRSARRQRRLAHADHRRRLRAYTSAEELGAHANDSATRRSAAVAPLVHTRSAGGARARRKSGGAPAALRARARVGCRRRRPTSGLARTDARGVGCGRGELRRVGEGRSGVVEVDERFEARQPRRQRRGRTAAERPASASCGSAGARGAPARGAGGGGGEEGPRQEAASRARMSSASPSLTRARSCAAAVVIRRSPQT